MVNPSMWLVMTVQELTKLSATVWSWLTATITVAGYSFKPLDVFTTGGLVVILAIIVLQIVKKTVPLI